MSVAHVNPVVASGMGGACGNITKSLIKGEGDYKSLAIDTAIGGALGGVAGPVGSLASGVSVGTKQSAATIAKRLITQMKTEV